jgi:hypothetical protein
MLHCNNGGGRVVSEAFEAVAALMTAPSGYVAMGAAATLLVLMRRTGQGRKRTD